MSGKNDGFAGNAKQTDAAPDNALLDEIYAREWEGSGVTREQFEEYYFHCMAAREVRRRELEQEKDK